VCSALPVGQPFADPLPATTVLGQDAAAMHSHREEGASENETTVLLGLVVNGALARETTIEPVAIEMGVVATGHNG